jgi:ribosomal protein S18 acetylase RimI-like enzyme
VLSPRTAPTWTLRPWPNDPSAKLLVFADHLTVPNHDDLEQAVLEARRAGARVLRTSALFPRASEVALEHGFVTIDTLCLLRLALDDEVDRRLASRSSGTEPDLRPMRAWHHAAAAHVDQDAFGSVWGNDAASLADIRRATPHHRARMVRDGRQIAGFAIAGRGGECGYLQRVAVATSHRRRGIARALVVDALRWMRRQSLATAYVNTGFENVAALALYASLGFRPMDDRLTIVERQLDR